jgi:isochorismate hydrolase
MMTEEVTEYLNTLDKEQVVLCGIESHVCVLQTAMDLIQQGKEVHVVADAVSSQRAYDRTVAMERLKDIGVYFTTSESLMFQLLKTSTHPHFKACSKLLKEANLDINSFGDKTSL